MVVAAEAADALMVVIDEVKRGTLRVFGEWFGGKPYDNWHVPVSTRVEGQELVVVFHDDEELRVLEPGEWLFTSETFRIQHARCVTWHWYYYGRPKVPENWRTIEHRLGPRNRVLMQTDAPFGRSRSRASTKFPAVELLSY